MDRHEFAVAAAEMREAASDYLRAYCRIHAHYVSGPELEAIVGALGDISLDEAIAAIDRLHAARGGA